MSMRELRSILFCLGPWAAAAVLGQPGNVDCANADTLCAQQPMAGNNTGASSAPGFCGSTSSAVWYSFSTNSQGGQVNVNVSGILCPSIAGMDNELSVVVLSGDGSCLPNSFSAAGPCVQDSVNFQLTTVPLTPNTVYWVVVAGVADNGALLPAECDFMISIGGPGADIVGVDFTAGMDLTIGEGGNTQLQATGGTTYIWSPTSGLSGSNIPDPFAQPSETTTYTVSTPINGCVYTDSVIVEVKRLINAPNMISPNGDGKNDTWDIRGIQAYPQCQVSIYDRWGQRVFFSTGYKEVFTGGGLPTATYYWVIDLNILQGVSEPYTGFLTLVN
jgi:gliding motility-associated-like protein